MWKHRLALTLAAAFALSVLGALPASARSDPTLTVTCTGGQVVVSDANSLTGQQTANDAYNSVNPFGEVCTVHP